jgi:hypothetical protein
MYDLFVTACSSDHKEPNGMFISELLIGNNVERSDY